MGQVAVACVIQDIKGSFIDGFGKVIAPNSSVLLAEAIAVREACILCIKVGIREACIESYNSSVVSWCINADGVLPWEIRTIRASLSFSAVCRSANEVANWIARHTLSSDSWSVDLGCIPHKLALLICKDSNSR